MKLLLKRLFAIVVSVMLVISLLPPKADAAAFDVEQGYKSLDIRFWNDEKPPIGFYINASTRYILETVTEPKTGSTYGEWSVMDLLRAKYTGYDYINYVPPTYFDDYITRVEKYVKENNGVLDTAKSTEWSRLTLALSALGYDIRNVAGYNFVNELSKSHAFSYKQGINGPIWEIIALNTGGYELYTAPIGQKTGDITNTFGLMIDYILSKEITQDDGTIGGWALTGKTPDPDITGMALQALAPYYLDKKLYEKSEALASYEQFATAVERGILAMKNMQLNNGSFQSWGTTNSESTVQVIVALTALQLDPLSKSIALPRLNTTVSFVTKGEYYDGVWTNNPIDVLISFWAPGSGSSAVVGGFKHVTTGFDGGGGSGTSVNAMATDQALYGLIAYDRFLKNKNALYDMSDMINGEHRSMKASNYSVTFEGNNVGKTSAQQLSPYALLTIPMKANVYSWNTESDGSGTRYLPGDKLVMPEHSITLYAQSEANSIDVDMKSVQAVIDVISKLPKADQVNREHENTVNLAVAEYNKLTNAEKKKVTNHSELALIEGKLKQLLAQYDDELKVTNLNLTIDNLAAVNPLTADYEEAIYNARASYNTLTAAQKLQIKKLSKLEMLEAKIAILIDQEKQEHQAGIETSDVVKVSVADVIAKINVLPSLQKLTLNHGKEVRKVRIYADLLSAQERAKVTNLSTLVALEQKLEQLTKEALQKEEFEDDVNDLIGEEPDNTGGIAQSIIKGKQLQVVANKVTGSFDVQLNSDIIGSLTDYSLKTLQLTDERGVRITIDATELLKSLKKVKQLKAVRIYISQYDAQTGLFEIKLEAMNQKGSSQKIKMDKSYIDITIPYNFFIDGNRLNEKVAMRMDGKSKVAVSHISKANELQLKIKSDGIFMLTKSNVQFTDIVKTSTKEDILYLANRGVINGSGNKYNPNNEITRAQFARMLTRALGLEAKATTSVFKDVRGKDYEQAVQALYEAGIIQGKTPTTFNPSASITNQQIALMMARTLRYVGFNTASITPTINFKDGKKISKQALSDVGMLNTLKIMTGNSKGLFNPNAKLKRAEMAKILRKTLKQSNMM